MKQYKIGEAIEACGIFMGLCEEFPELYDKYVKKIENGMKNYRLGFEAIDEEKKQVMEKTWRRIKSGDWE